MRISSSLVLIALAVTAYAQSGAGSQWKHLTTGTRDFPPPNAGTEQTSATVFDIDSDGVNDFVITERTAAPAVVWYKKSQKGWDRFVIECGPLHIEAGSTFFDVDGDGDLDFEAAGDYRSKEVWWWENPAPHFEPDTPWKRHLIKNSGNPKHHDSTVASLLGDGKNQLVFWNQDSHKLLMAIVPPDPRAAEAWPLKELYLYNVTSQPEQRGKAAAFKGINEHEGLAAADIDGDGKIDLVAGGHWLRNLGEGQFEANVIDAGYTFSRAVAGHLINGAKTQQVVLIIGDGEGPLMWYELVKGTWVSHKVADLNYGHNLQLIDFDGDGNLDIFAAEQRLNCANPAAKAYVFLGDGKGDFTPRVLATGLDSHESKIADLDGDGDFDLLIKPYNCETPRLDILLNLTKH